jgi:hypothetical protein
MDDLLLEWISKLFHTKSDRLYCPAVFQFNEQEEQ